MTGEPMHTTSEMVSHNPATVYQLSSEKRNIHYASLSAMFNLLHSISNQELFEKHFYNPCIPKERNGTTYLSYINYCLNAGHCKALIIIINK